MKEILKLEKEEFNGNFYKFQSRIYAYFVYQLEKNNVEKLTSNMYPKSILRDVIYEGVYAKPDHMYSKIIDNCINDMKKQKIIAYKKVDNIWYLEILGKPSFLPDKLLEKYLLHLKGEKIIELGNLSIFKIKRFCWKCNSVTESITPIYGVKDNNFIDYIDEDNSIVVDTINILGDNNLIDEEIARRCNGIKKQYTMSSDETYYLNVCKCGAVQGRHYLYNSVVEMINNRIYIEKE